MGAEDKELSCHQLKALVSHVAGIQRLHPRGWTGNSCKNPAWPCCVCVVVGWGENSPVSAREPAPGCSRASGGREGARPRSIWSGCLTVPTPGPQPVCQEPHPGPRSRAPPGSTRRCQVATQTACGLPVNVQPSGNRKLPFITRKRGRGQRGAQAVPELAGRGGACLDGQSSLSSALCSELWKFRGQLGHLPMGLWGPPAAVEEVSAAP